MSKKVEKHWISIAEIKTSCKMCKNFVSCLDNEQEKGIDRAYK